MAIKPQQDTATPKPISNRLQQSAPLLFKSDLEDHKKSPRAKARLQRVKEMLQGDPPTN
jgi:hypothetical protein